MLSAKDEAINKHLEKGNNMGLKILHLSDLHISSNEDLNYTTLRKGILKYLRENQVRIDLVAFTGDIVDRNDVTAFSKAREFFQELLEICGLTSERLLIVPGNHDMERLTIKSQV